MNGLRLHAWTVVSALCFTVSAAGQSAGTLAPTGTLRAVFLGTNPVHGRVDTGTGAVTGPVADLTAELARRLGVPHRLIAAPNAAGVIAELAAGRADIGYLAYETARANEVDFAGGFAVMASTHVVRRESSMRTVGDVERAGIRVGAVGGQSQELYLSGTLKLATVRRFDTQPSAAEVRRLLESGELDAFAMNQQRAEDAAAATSGALRFLSGSYLDAVQSFVVKKGDSVKAADLKPFIEAVRSSGFIQQAITRAKLAGVTVAPR